MERIGFDFMCREQQHHNYHIGALVNGYISELHLDKSCEFESQLKMDLNIASIKYHDRFGQTILFIKLLFKRKKLSIIGINSKSIIWLLPLTFFGSRIELHVHGQIAGIRNPLKRLFWKINSLFFSIVVGNPIYTGPRFVKCIGNVGKFEYLSKPNQLERLCILYGSNKSFLNDLAVKERIESAGIPVLTCCSDEGYISTNKIINAAKQATHTFIQLKLDQYLLSPSGRICDLSIYDLKPLVFKEDTDTQNVLKYYDIQYIEID